MPGITIEPANLKIIHTGTKSTLYLQETSSIGFPIVLKVLNDEFPSSQQIRRFNNEYDCSQEIGEIPGVRRVFEKRKYLKKNALVMEYVPGITITEQLAEPMALEEFLQIAIGIAGTLALLHRHHIIHKNICSNNILVHPPGLSITIIDLGLASKLDTQIQNLPNPSVLEGTLPYLSPEQTGRMNRVVDYRTDLYSLGVTFYELLAGRLPFVYDDPLALVHAHIAIIPPPLHTVNQIIPRALSDIVRKLMEKNAEDRYQSADGLRRDLVHCLTCLERDHQVEPFDLGREDYSDRFLIPQTLYGIDAQKNILLDAFRRVADGKAGCVMVTGYSGVGKTSLVNEIHKPMTEHHGFFISGKFDQYEKARPYSAIIQAFTSLINTFLMEDDESVLSLKSDIEKKIETNGRVLVDLIPNLELILGPQPAVMDLDPLEALNRFNMVCRNFISAISTQEHPLILFLDDLQWVDHASLSLIRTLLTDDEISSFLLIGAYRTNEVTDSHPLLLTLEDLKRSTVPIDTIVLSDLSPQSVTSLLVDTLHDGKEGIAGLSELISRKTGGNAFFVHQFLKTLYEDGHLVYDERSRRWNYHLQTISSTQYTENVVELMVGNISKLPPEEQRILRLASCIGNRFSLQTLAAISGKSQNDLIHLLSNAIQAGLIISLGESLFLSGSGETTDDSIREFTFLHDRVQQAAYSLISEDERAIFHLEIGRTLLATNSDQDDSSLFQIAGQFNKGLDLIRDNSERIGVAELNLKAGQKAKRAHAHVYARDLLRAGMTLLPSESWYRYHDLTFNLFLERAECEYSLFQTEESKRILLEALDHSISGEERLSIFIQQIYQATWEGRFSDGIRIAIRAFEEFDIFLPDLEDQPGIDRYVQDQAVWFSENWKDRPISELALLPESTVPAYSLLTHILGNLIDAGIVIPAYLPVLTYTSVNLSIEYGNTPNSAYGLISHGMTLAATSPDYISAYEFGKAGLTLSERIPDKKIATRVTNLFVFMGYVGSPLAEIPPYGEQAYHFGMDSGDVTHAGYGLINAHRALVSAGVPLSECSQKADSYLSLIIKLNRKFVIDNIMVSTVQLIHELTGKTPYPELYDQDEIDAFLRTTDLDFVNALAKFYRVYSLIILEKENEALDLIHLDFLPFLETTVHRVEYRFIVSLLYLRLIPGSDDPQKIRNMGVVQEYLSFIQEIARAAPYNFLPMVRLIEAELAALGGDPLQAMHLYDEAIQLANEQNFIQYEAIAHECAGKFWLGLGKSDFAGLYLQKSAYCYGLWGASEKVKDMKVKYQDLFSGNQRSFSFSSQDPGPFSSGSSDISSSEDLDLTTIIKASQALSEEVFEDALIEKMIRFVMENAGATKGVLLTMADDSLVVRAVGDAHTHQVDTTITAPFHEYARVPHSIIRYCERTRNPAILQDVQKETAYNKDPYIRSEQPQSIVCMPIESKGRLLGILYLENNLSPRVFTQERFDLLRILGSQVAISIENARLYQHLADEVDQRTLKIQNQSRFLQTLIETLPIPIFYKDINGVYTGCNSEFEHYFGRPRDQIIGKSVFDLWPKEMAERYRQADLHVFQSRAHQQYEAVIQYHDRSVHDVIFYKAPIVNESDQVDGLIGTFLDITERKRIEEALKESELFNRGLVENLPEYIVVCRSDGTILYVNPLVTESLGYQYHEMMGQHVQSFIVEKDRKRAADAMQKRNEGHDVPFYKIDILTRHLGVRSVIVKGTSIQYQNSQATLFLLIDITERKRLEKTLIESEEKFRSIFEKTPDPILILNSAYQIIDVNRGFENYFERPNAGENGKTVECLGIWSKKVRIGDILKNSEEDSSAPHYEMELIKKTGVPFIAEVAKSRIVVDNESCFIIQIHDIDDIRKAHEAIAQVNHKLKILSSITRHDILNRTLIASGYCDLLLQENQDPDLQRKLASIRRSSGEIENLIEFTRHYQNLGETTPTWHVVEEIFKSPSVKGLLSGVDLILDLKGLEIYADNMLEKVIYNLVENSVRHGQNLTTIRLSRHEDSGNMVIGYEDDGGGIVPEEKERAFEKGFGKNTGLGLFLIREILSITGISITENGIPGIGVNFEMIVPAGKWRE
jgi:PAS domain S-box-containing protein